MKFPSISPCLLIASLALLCHATVQRPSYRRLQVQKVDDWKQELLNEIPRNSKLARSLKAENWMAERPLKRSAAEAKRIQRQIAKLKRKLHGIDPKGKTRPYFKAVAKHRKDTRKLETRMAGHLKQNVFRALVLQKILNTNNNVSSAPNPLAALDPQLAGNVSPVSAAPVELTPKIRKLLLKNLTMGDFDTIAKNKLTMARYTKLQEDSIGLSEHERKQRYLNVISDTLSGALQLVMDTVGGITNTAGSLMGGTTGKVLGAGALGVFAGLKMKKNKLFLHNRERTLRKIEMFETVNTLIEEEGRGTAKTSDIIMGLITRTKSITKNLNYRFDNKSRMFASNVD